MSPRFFFNFNDMQENFYYIVSNGHSEGPFPKEILRMRSITPDTLVWCQGMPEWKRAGDVEELTDILVAPAREQVYPEETHPDSEPTIWFAMINGNRVGPCTIDELIRMGLNPSTPVWCEGMPDWYAASARPEIMQRLHRSGNNATPESENPYYASNGFSKGNTNRGYTSFSQQGQGNYGQYGSGNGYNGHNAGFNGNFPAGYTNWLVWAIVATVVGALTNCISLILGIVAIIQANKANTFMQQGFEDQAASSNSTAKTLCIISLILSGLSIIGVIAMFTSGLMSSVWF